jgi:hypothetical protein
MRHRRCVISSPPFPSFLITDIHFSVGLPKPWVYMSISSSPLRDPCGRMSFIFISSAGRELLASVPDAYK